MYDSTKDTRIHQLTVAKYIRQIICALEERCNTHDESKLLPPEKEAFDIATPKLKELTYGSEEYKQSLREIQDAISHHYKYNRHHPEHFSDGIAGMNLVDIIEMLCDWVAATKRHTDGNIWESITHNATRFGYDGNMIAILENTVRALND
jgi:hypothetical protein